MIYQIRSINSDNTEKIAESIGLKLRGGEVIQLISDLGGGKTVFAKGLARGAGSHDQVTSPTFTISKIYHTPLFDIHHFDFYRLNNPGIIELELKEVLNDINVVVLIEWGDVIAEILPKNTIRVKIDNLNENERQISINYPKEYHYLVEDL